jgi:hypothetical protein
MFIPRYPIHTDLSYKDGFVLSDEAENLHNQRSWLQNALVMDVYNSTSNSIRTLANVLFDEIVDKTGLKVKSLKRVKQSLKTVLINLWLSNLLGMPVRYSRDKSAYSHNRKYGKLYFKYHTLLPVIDALFSLGYIEEKKGRSSYEDKKKGYQTRIWPTPALIGLFIDYQLLLPNFFLKPEPKELIIKKDKSKKLVGYREDKSTNQMREDLECYNEFVKKHQITVKLQSKVSINYDFLLNLFRNIITNRIAIEQILYKNNQIVKHNRIPQHILKRYTDTVNSNPPINTPTITQEFPCKPPIDNRLYRICFYAKWRFIDFLASLNRKLHGKRKKNDECFLELFPLEKIGIEHLEFILNQEYLYRVFNRNSFQYGGRAYGAIHQNLPKNMRPFIHINGEKTVEIDYSAYHILMLYNQEGIDYQDDPYSVCEGPEMRDIYKAVGLIAINAKKHQAYLAIRDELEDRGIPMPARKKPLVSLVKTFRDAHRDIEQYLFSDIGVTLQNTDGHIMNAILMRLMDKGILGLSVYDSVIVAEQHEAFTKEVMIEEYKKIMGFNPRF